MGAINSQKLRDTMNESGYSSVRMANAINEKFPNSNVKHYHIDNIVHNNYSKLSDKTLKKLELISEVLNKPVSTFLNMTKNTPKDDVRYDGRIFREAAQLVEEIFENNQVQPSMVLIQQYSQEAHNFAIQNNITDTSQLKLYIEGAVGASIRAGILTTSTQ